MLPDVHRFPEEQDELAERWAKATWGTDVKIAQLVHC
jgi:hypothetical protein